MSEQVAAVVPERDDGPSLLPPGGQHPGVPDRGDARFAWLVSDGFEPRNWMLALAPLLGWHAEGATGAQWGLFAAVFTSVLPSVILSLGERRSYWSDRHVRQRQERLVAGPVVLASVCAGTGLLYGLGGARVVCALVAAMLTVLIALMAITFFWKVSVHCAVAAGALAVLASLYGPAWALSAPLVVLIGWSRVRLRCHTIAQVMVGAGVGAVVAGTTFDLLR
ncbi:hypothetical protein [Streptomyces sp. YS415]|uniref:hypothetical protein n=1 Tax=Streptomyces sp. YS415 TaxID=2944806 RepID=UPI0020218D5E|nr:hypothetical protein [Streptomyces sp. YS415]MCL7427124.1 hypothetical protein [Streptomyces sp. YS415]